MAFDSASKIFENLVNHMVVDYLKKCDLFSDFRYMVSGLFNQLQPADLVTTETDRIAGAFVMLGAARSGRIAKNGHKDSLSYNINQLRVTFLFLCWFIP